MILKKSCFSASVIPLGFEPKTHRLEICCSIQLSYGTRPLNALEMKEKAFSYKASAKLINITLIVKRKDEYFIILSLN